MSKASIEIGGGNWAAKDTKLLGYAVGDTSGKYLPRELAFSRGADIAATRVNKDGLVEKYRENLFTYSNDFRRSEVSPAPWGHAGLQAYYGPQNNPESVPSAGKAGYDGSNGASFLLSSTADARHEVTLSQTFDGVQTISVYAKAGGYNFLFIRTQSANNEAFFNLSTGSVGTTASQVVEAKMESVGSDWYRCSMTLSGNFTTVAFGMTQQDNVKSFAGDGSSGIYIMHAQRERGLVATKYMESATSTTGKAGVLDNLPRIDYTDGAAHLLLEPQRINLVPKSEYFPDSQGTRVTVTVNTTETLSPEGVYNAVKMMDEATGDANHTHVIESLETASSLDNSTVYTVSAFVKDNGRDAALNLSSGTGLSNRAAFSLSGSGSVLATGSFDSASIEEYGNGWFRIIATGTTDSSAGATKVFLRNLNRSIANDADYLGDATKGIYFYGLQLEKGAFATSYIPTYAAAATRTSEGLPALSGSVIDMSGFMKGDDVTLVAHWADNPQQTRDTSTGGIRLSNGNSQSGSVRIYRNNDNDRYMSVVFFGTSGDSFGSGVNSSSVMLSSATPKVAVRRVRSTGVFTVYLNGSPLDAGLTDANGDFTNSNFDVTWDDLQISGGSQQKYLLIKLFDSALTNSEMASETS